MLNPVPGGSGRLIPAKPYSRHSGKVSSELSPQSLPVSQVHSDWMHLPFSHSNSLSPHGPAVVKAEL